MSNKLIPKDQFNKFFEQVCNALINKEFTDDRMANLTLGEFLKENGVEITLPDSLADKIRPMLMKKMNEDFSGESRCTTCFVCAVCSLCGEVNGAAGIAGLVAAAGLQ